MKNRMDVPNEYEPVLPRKVKAHIEKKKAQDTDKNALLTQIALAVGNVIGQLKLENPLSWRRLMSEICHPSNSKNSNSPA